MTKDEKIKQLEDDLRCAENEKNKYKELAYRDQNWPNTGYDDPVSYRSLYENEKKRNEQILELLCDKENEIKRVWFVLREALKSDVKDNPENGVYQNPFNFYTDRK